MNVQSIKILHVLPDSAIDPVQKFLGSTKDLRGRTEYFRARGFGSEEIVVPHRKDSELKRLLKSKDISAFQAIFVELPIYPSTLRYLRHSHPELRVFVRSINAEFYHDWHYVISGFKHGHWKNAFRYVFFSWRRLYWDFVCAHEAEHLFCITEWEEKNYWHYIAGRKKPVTLPYYLPSEYVSNVMHLPKSDSCVCLLSTIPNSFLVDAAENFINAVAGLGTDLPNWDFHLTGADSLMPRNPTARVKSAGHLDTPYDILAKSRAIAILSDYGFGIKTKILDAILHKCFVLVTSGLYGRLPDVIKPCCIVVNLEYPDAFRRALDGCLRPFPNVDVNSLLRRQAFAALDAVFGIN